MVIFENYMFEFSVSKDMKLPKKTIKWRTTTYLLTLIVKKIEINGEHDRMAPTINIIKH